jgi:hypothetical protein
MPVDQLEKRIYPKKCPKFLGPAKLLNFSTMYPFPPSRAQNGNYNISSDTHAKSLKNS